MRSPRKLSAKNKGKNMLAKKEVSEALKMINKEGQTPLERALAYHNEVSACLLLQCEFQEGKDGAKATEFLREYPNMGRYIEEYMNDPKECP